MSCRPVSVYPYIIVSECSLYFPFQTSVLCKAAVHAGVIMDQFGGPITVEDRRGLSHYPAVRANGIQSKEWVTAVVYVVSLWQKLEASDFIMIVFIFLGGFDISMWAFLVHEKKKSWQLCIYIGSLWGKTQLLPHRSSILSGFLSTCLFVVCLPGKTVRLQLEKLK